MKRGVALRAATGNGDGFDRELGILGDRALGCHIKREMERIGDNTRGRPDPHRETVNPGGVLLLGVAESDFEGLFNETEFVHGEIEGGREARSLRLWH